MQSFAKGFLSPRHLILLCPPEAARLTKSAALKLKIQVEKRFYLTDDDIAKFTDSILPSLLYSLYTKDGVASKVRDLALDFAVPTKNVDDFLRHLQKWL